MSWNLTRDIGAAFGGVLSQLGLTEPVAGDLNNEEVWRICAQCCEDVYYLFKPAGNAVGSAHEDYDFKVLVCSGINQEPHPAIQYAIYATSLGNVLCFMGYDGFDWNTQSEQAFATIME